MVKNIIDRYIDIVKEEFKEYSKLILGKNFDLDIFNSFLNDYIDARYFNFIDNENIRTFRDKIIKVITNTQNNLEIKRPHDKKLIIDESNIFKNILTFDSVSIVKSEESAINALNDIYWKNNTKDYFKSRFIEKNVFYENKRDELKEKYESEVFYLKYKKLDLDTYYADISYKIKFPKIYNREFIKNVFCNGITNEDKLQVEYSMLSKEILYVILIILIYNIILVGISYISRQDFNGIFGYKAYNITTNSMEPNINKGDIILIKKPKKEEKIKIGDVISFKNDGQIITHRIVDISDTNGVKRYITKGDNNNVPDLQKISFEQIEGVEILRIPYLGQIVSAMENQVILLIIILLILIIYLYSLNTKEKSEIRRAKRMKYMEENHNNKL